MKDGKTRREFVKEMAGSAFVGTLVGMEAFAFEVPKTPEDKEKLVAPCGLYCGACPMYLASQEKDEQKVQVLLQQFSIRGSKTVPTNFQGGCGYEGLLCDSPAQ
jgi:hypothetical protein